MQNLKVVDIFTLAERVLKDMKEKMGAGKDARGYVTWALPPDEIQPPEEDHPDRELLTRITAIARKKGYNVVVVLVDGNRYMWAGNRLPLMESPKA